MKLTKQVLSLLCFFSWPMAALLAQKDIAKFFPSGKDNSQKLIEGYIRPISEDFGSVASNGWYTSAATHKKWGFDLNVTVNTISLKSDDEFFTSPTLSGVTYNGTTAAKDPLPTAYGPSGVFPLFTINSGANAGRSFQGPDGTDPKGDIKVGAIAVPTIQGGIGLFANTDLRLRYTPKITVNNIAVENYGVAIMHDIKQHIPGIKQLPFSLSLLVGYSQLTATTDLKGIYTGTGQEGVAKAASTTAQLLVGKSLKLISFYAAVGYNSSMTKYSVNGSYLVDSANGIPLFQSFTLTDPFAKEFKASGVRATGGLRFNFGPITLNGDYTLFNTKGLITAGFGFTVR